MSDMERVLRDGIKAALLAGSAFRMREILQGALTAALPAPGDAGDAGDWVMVPRQATVAMMHAFWLAGPYPEKPWQAGYAALLSAAPHPPVSPGEISQAQAQAMREALVGILAIADDKAFASAESRLAMIGDNAEAALAAVPDPAA